MATRTGLGIEPFALGQVGRVDRNRVRALGPRPEQGGGDSGGDGGTNPWDNNSRWNIAVEGFTCPSDGQPYEDKIGYNNYVFCGGDEYNTEDTNRGAFKTTWNNPFVRDFSSFTDGLSNTQFMSEVHFATGEQTLGRAARYDSPIPNDCKAQYNSSTRQYIGTVGESNKDRGSRWGDGAPYFVGYQSILPPNSPSCIADDHDSSLKSTMLSAASRHPGGVNVLFGDGSVHFISETIDSGDQTYPCNDIKNYPNAPRSPYGVWGALGSINGGEVVSDF